MSKFILEPKRKNYKKSFKIFLSKILGMFAILIYYIFPKNKKIDSNKILIFSFWGLGDSVQQTPLFYGLREKYPKKELYVVSSKRSREYLKFLNIFDKIYEDVVPWSNEEKKYRIISSEYINFLKFLITLRNANFDVAISTRADARDNLFLVLINSKKIICNSEYFGSILSSVKLKFVRKQNKLIYISGLCSKLSLKFKYEIKHLKSKKSNQISVFLDSNDPTKKFSLEKILLALKDIESIKEYEINVIGKEFSKEQTKIVEKYRRVNSIKTKNINELINILSKSRYYIGTDSGPSHIASILGVKSLVIFTSGTPYEDTPFENSQALFLEDFPCRPCMGNCIYRDFYCSSGFNSINLNKYLSNFFENNDNHKQSKLIPIKKI